MKISDQVAAKAGYFYIHTTFNSDKQLNYLVNEFSRGTDGHFKSAARTTKTYDPFYKFLIYPDPNGEKGPKGETCYRMIVPEYERHVVDFYARLTLQLPSESKNQLFMFQETASSRLDPGPKPQFEWYNIRGVGKNDLLWIEPISWVHPAEDRSDAGEIEHMKFRFEACDVQEPDKTKLKQVDLKDPARSHRPKDDEEIDFKEFGQKHVSTEAIPAAYVTDTSYANKIAQLQFSPYYYLRLDTVWVKDLVPPITVGIGEEKNYEKTSTTAFKSEHYESVQKTVGYTIDASLEGKVSQEIKVTAGEGDVKGEGKQTRSATLKLAAQYKNQTQTINRDQTSQSSEVSYTVKRTYKATDRGYRVVFWTPVDRFQLFDSNKNLIGEWEHADIEFAEEQRINMQKPA